MERQKSLASPAKPRRYSIKNLRLVDPRRYLLGYNRYGSANCLLAMKLRENPQMAHVFRGRHSVEHAHRQTFACDCNRSLLQLNTGDGFYEKIGKQHTCIPVPIRKIFFDLKKYTLIHGTEDEIKKFEESTASTCEEPGYSKVAQKDWCFAKVEEIAKYSVIVIFEKDRRSHGKLFLKDEEGCFYCSGCGEQKTKLIVDKSASGIHVIWSPSNEAHILSCNPTLISTLTAEYGYKLEDTKEYDSFQILPKEDWKLGHSASERNSRLYITSQTDKSLCYLYIKINPKYISKSTSFRCARSNTCKCFAGYQPKTQRVTVANMDHQVCKPKLWESVLKEQRVYDKNLPLEVDTTTSRLLITDYYKMPQIGVARIMAAKDDSKKIFIRSKEDPDRGHVFCADTDPLFAKKRRAKFKCASCSATAIDWKPYLFFKSDEKHEASCQLVTFDPQFWVDVDVDQNTLPNKDRGPMKRRQSSSIQSEDSTGAGQSLEGACSRPTKKNKRVKRGKKKRSKTFNSDDESSEASSSSDSDVFPLVDMSIEVGSADKSSRRTTRSMNQKITNFFTSSGSRKDDSSIAPQSTEGAGTNNKMPSMTTSVSDQELETTPLLTHNGMDVDRTPTTVSDSETFNLNPSDGNFQEQEIKHDLSFEFSFSNATENESPAKKSKNDFNEEVDEKNMIISFPGTGLEPSSPSPVFNDSEQAIEAINSTDSNDENSDSEFCEIIENEPLENFENILLPQRASTSILTDLKNLKRQVFFDSDLLNPTKQMKMEEQREKRDDQCLDLWPAIKLELQNSSNCPLDLNELDEIKPDLAEIHFVRPSNVWLIECCKLLDVNSSNSAYKNWAMLRDVDLASTEFPELENVKTFKKGFELVSYLLTGSEEGASAVKEQIGMYFLDHYETMGGVEGLDCSKMTRKDVGSVIFAADMSPIHFKVVSKLFKCTVVIYNYLKKSKFVVKCEDSGAPTIVAGFNEEGYFVFLD